MKQVDKVYEDYREILGHKARPDCQVCQEIEARRGQPGRTVNQVGRPENRGQKAQQVTGGQKAQQASEGREDSPEKRARRVTRVSLEGFRVMWSSTSSTARKRC